VIISSEQTNQNDRFISPLFMALCRIYTQFEFWQFRAKSARPPETYCSIFDRLTTCLGS